MKLFIQELLTGLLLLICIALFVFSISGFVNLVFTLIEYLI